MVEFVVEWVVGGVVSAATTGVALVLLLRQRSGRRWGRVTGKSGASEDSSSEKVLVVGWYLWVWWVIASTLGWVVGGAVFYPVAIVTYLFTALPLVMVGVDSRALLGVVCGAVAGAAAAVGMDWLAGGLSPVWSAGPWPGHCC